MKGRGTRKFTFSYKDENGQDHRVRKTSFQILRFFANFEFFEEQFNYDEALHLPVGVSERQSDFGDDGQPVHADEIEVFDPDKIRRLTETQIGLEGMKIDRRLFEKAKDAIKKMAR